MRASTLLPLALCACAHFLGVSADQAAASSTTTATSDDSYTDVGNKAMTLHDGKSVYEWALGLCPCDCQTPQSDCAPLFGQCGGNDSYTGPTACCDGYCVGMDDSFSGPGSNSNSGGGYGDYGGYGMRAPADGTTDFSSGSGSYGWSEGDIMGGYGDHFDMQAVFAFMETFHQCLPSADDDLDPVRGNYTFDGRCLCPCSPLGATPPPPPRDPATFCLLEPDAPACAEVEAADANATIAYTWHTTTVSQQPCNADTDRFGHCGNANATVTFDVTCQKIATSVNGTRQVLAFYVDPATLTAGNATLPAGAVNSCTDAAKPSAASRTFACAARKCEVLEKQTRTVGACFSPRSLGCGPMKQVKEELCFSVSAGEYVRDRLDWVGTKCEGTRGMYLADCNAPVTACPTDPFLKYTPWGECSATCDGSSTDRVYSVSGTRTRGSTCVRYNADTGGATIATGCTETPVTSQSCDVKCRNPLRRYVKVLGDCNAACGTSGSRTVTYSECSEGVPGCKTYPDVASAGAATPEPCQGRPCDPCASNKCVPANTAGTRTSPDGLGCTCVCNDGWAGSRCHYSTAAGATAPQVRDASGAVCASGTLDVTGACCDAGVELDGCGYCASRAVPNLGAVRVGFDIDGQCCAGASGVFLTGDFTCCPGADSLDECGVCGGTGATCKKAVDGSATFTGTATAATFGDAIAAAMPLPAGTWFSPTTEHAGPPGGSRRRLLAQASGALGALGRRLMQTAVAYTLEPTSSEVSAGSLAGSWVVSSADSGDIVASEPAPGVAGIADNQVCETGEPDGSGDCITPVECPVATSFDGTNFIGRPALVCSGNGVCALAEGTCACALGYTGDACDRCDGDNGYTDVPLGGVTACTRLASDFTSSEPTEAPPTDVAAPPPGHSEHSEGLGAGAIAGAVIGATAGVAVIAGGAYYVTRVRGAKNVGPQP